MGLHLNTALPHTGSNGGKLIEIMICNIRILCSQRYAMCVCVCVMYTISVPKPCLSILSHLTGNYLSNGLGPKNVLCILLFYQCAQSSLTSLTSFITVVAYYSSGLVLKILFCCASGDVLFHFPLPYWRNSEGLLVNLQV